MCITFRVMERRSKPAKGTTGRSTPPAREAGNESGSSHVRRGSSPANSHLLGSIEAGTGTERTRASRTYRAGRRVANRADYRLCVFLLLRSRARAVEIGAAGT